MTIIHGFCETPTKFFIADVSSGPKVSKAKSWGQIPENLPINPGTGTDRVSNTLKKY